MFLGLHSTYAGFHLVPVSRGIVLGTDYETTTLLRTTVDRLNDIDQFLLVLSADKTMSAPQSKPGHKSTHSNQFSLLLLPVPKSP